MNTPQRHETPPSFTCPSCGTVSHHPKDVQHGYCPRCHRFTRADANAARALRGLEDARHHADGPTIDDSQADGRHD